MAKKELIKKIDALHRVKFQSGVCYTCGYRGKTEVGHFISRRYIYIRWHKNNCRKQCINCNRFLNGNLVMYENLLIGELGEHQIDHLHNIKNNYITLDFLKSEYERIKNEL